ncbi:MAG: DUF3795 domain-containing protein [Verrucomicrobia bacterium]|nr:DUF3795 domain-containing protein [Verrucomicrobiota bacterium]MBU1910046.1 DUF3795 domain-containing protein [Verrucomicrobiota bacterium]
MKNDQKLIAPCGMHCAVCSAYLAWAHAVPRQRGKITHCEGCRPRNKQCAFLKKRCSRLRNNRVRFCYECPDFPCAPLSRIDARYRNNYGMSLIGNLEEIRDHGMAAFLKHQRKEHGCPSCGDWVSVHNKKCFACQPVHSWKDQPPDHS